MPAAPARSRRRASPATPSAGLSVIVPVFNESENLIELHARIAAVARALKAERSLRTEVIYVDDGSRDNTREVASELPAAGLDVQVVALSRNFGKEAALLAGLEHARLDAIMFMDGDGQHPPELIETLVSRWIDDNYDVVYTAKAHRHQESRMRRFGVKWFYTLLNWGARHKIPEDAGDFRLLSPRAAAALRQMPERNRFLKGMASWIGFRQIRVDYEPAERAHGVTTWNLPALIGLSVEGLTSFTVAPLRFASLLGALFGVVSLIFAIWILGETIFFGKDVPGYPSIVVSVMILGSVQLLMIGVLGEYIGKLLWEAKRRPAYFVADHLVKSASDSAKTRTARAAE
jgi:glycosyltransferase involved in cell wall biosynthesis